MRKYVVIVILNIVFVIFNQSFLNEFLGADLSPIFVLAISYAYFFSDKTNLAYFSALFGGLILDLQGFEIIGIFSTMFVLFILISSLIKKYLFKALLIHVLFLFVFNLIAKLYLTFPDFYVSSKFVISSVITSVISIIFFTILRKTGTRYISSEYRIKT